MPDAVRRPVSDCGTTNWSCSTAFETGSGGQARPEVVRGRPAPAPAPARGRRPGDPDTPETTHARRPPERVTRQGAGGDGRAGAPASLPCDQVHALRRQQQRILHRSALIDYVLAAEKRGGEPLTMGDALAELLADITEAARTIGTLLQTATGRPERDVPVTARLAHQLGFGRY